VQRRKVHAHRRCHIPGAETLESALCKLVVAGLNEGYTTGRVTSRLDLAACMLRLLEDEPSVRTAVAVATVAVEPKLLQMLMREAFSHRATAVTSEV